MDNTSKIISFLGKNIGNAFTMHELSNLLRIPYATFHRTISRMDNTISIAEVGKSKTIKLNPKHPIARARLAVASDEEKIDYLEKEPILRKIAIELSTRDIVVLFGSYAKGTHTPKSDIDLLIINKDGKKSLSFSKYELLFKKKINPIFVTKREFENMLKEKDENVGKQALKSHIVLNNPESFWGCVLNAV
ncbi:nucleotidyltransferase domain-containing protein [Candidatus Woesearchaeota archaeon]|nr:nucleotidyltransferase domain-containing protein [Candidatus Woesearchaeota archaeon]MBI2660845.1 nucleotidyltransferase domain-containing protein [Candidatus Woesearchaeota archaeon]